MTTTESESLSGVPKSVFNFTSDLCQIFRKSIEKNYVCSSLSAHIALSMAACGANGNTAVEMRQVLHLSDDEFKLLEDYQKVIDTLNTDENAEDDHNLDIQLDEEVAKISEYKDMTEEDKCKLIQEQREEHEALSTYFRSKSETLDFLKKKEFAQIIDDWCSEATNGKISKMINSDKLSEDTAMILVNAVYFKGKWVHEFTNVELRPFHLSRFSKIEVPTMHLKRRLHYRNLQELDAKAVRLDFMQSSKYMEIIVPNAINGLKNIEKDLHKISNKPFKYTRVSLRLPKFEVQTEIKFEDYLTIMGMKDAFEEGSANFNKICDRPLFINNVLQKAYIKVDELGCEAAAVTVVQMDTEKSLTCYKKKPKYIKIKADRPFLFRIMDSRLDIPLFIGRIFNPIE